MLQSLLADRFKLKLRRETKDFDVYALVVDKSGSQAQAFEGWRSLWLRQGQLIHVRHHDRRANWLRCSSIPWAGPSLTRRGWMAGLTCCWISIRISSRGQTPPPDFDKPSLVTALREQLGLRLEPRKETFPMLVVETVQRPTEN